MDGLAPFPVNAELTAVSVAYSNQKLIADDVLPRVPVDTQAFKYNVYPKGEFFSPPDDEVSRTGRPNQIEFTGQELESSTVDHALDHPVPIADIINARNQPNANRPDPEKRATMGLTKLIMLKREVRSAELVFNAANYASGNKATLAGNNQWSDYDNSNPVAAIIDALDAMVMRGNIMTFGRASWTKIAQHPKVCKAVFGNNTDAGIVSRRALADLLELDDILVGEGWVNTAKKGQPVNLVRCWGKHASIMYRDRDADTNSQVTFGMTAQWGGRIAGSEFDRNIGMRGGQMVRVGESVKELITANDLGYYFENAVA